LDPARVYNWLIVPAMWAGFKACSPFIKKVHQGIKERRGWKRSLREWVDSRRSDKPIWMFHAASVGELEALLPIIRFLEQRGTEQVVVTVFSPSAYGIRDKIAGVGLMTYLPFDFIENQRFLLDALQPDLVVISKHDVWPNLLVAARERQIRTVLINANLHPGSLRTHRTLGWFNSWVFSMFDGIAAVSSDHAKRLQPFLDNHVTLKVLGDSRYDRVLERVKDRLPMLDDLLSAPPHPVIVAGSIHPVEEQMLVSAVADLAREIPKLQVIWVPHEPEPQALSSLEQLLAAHHLRAVRFSDRPDLEKSPAIIVDVVGVLAPIYKLGTIAVVGGGFDKGVHSVIEPAAAGLPVLFGPKYHVSQEASYLIERGGGFVFRNQKELAEMLRSLLGDSERLQAAGAKAKSVVEDNAGASKRIVGFLDNFASGM